VQPPLEPRLQPLRLQELDESLRPHVEGRPGTNLFATLGRHPALARRFMRFGNHFLAKGSLPPRDRELVILRTAWNLGAAYEWGHHVRIGQAAGLTRAEIDRVPPGAEAEGWPDFDRVLLTAADQLYAHHTVADSVWNGLSERYSAEQLVELAMLVGQYVMVGTVLLTLGIQPEAGLEPLPARPGGVEIRRGRAS
jgi:alkylhydroperoxidase family enzyme